MDINCTSKCMYQHDGKCNLNEVSSFTQIAYFNGETDCPYFSQPDTAQISMQ